MKDSPKEAQEEPEAGPDREEGDMSVHVGDHVFFRDRQGNHCTGEIKAHGKTGFTAKSDAGLHQVPWDSYVAHKSRKPRKVRIVDEGEDGSLGKLDCGKMIFLSRQQEAEPAMRKSAPRLLFMKGIAPMLVGDCAASDDDRDCWPSGYLKPAAADRVFVMVPGFARPVIVSGRVFATGAGRLRVRITNIAGPAEAPAAIGQTLPLTEIWRCYGDPKVRGEFSGCGSDDPDRVQRNADQRSAYDDATRKAVLAARATEGHRPIDPATLQAGDRVCGWDGGQRVDYEVAGVDDYSASLYEVGARERYIGKGRRRRRLTDMSFSVFSPEDRQLAMERFTVDPAVLPMRKSRLVVLGGKILKAHVAAYTKKDGTFVQEHDDRRVSREMASSSGGPAPSITDSSQFKQWFDGSKVVDKDGKPLVVYHGTAADFDSFERQDGSDFGFHFGSADQAHGRLAKKGDEQGQNIIPVYLSIKNPLRVKDAGYFDGDNDDFVNELRELGVAVRGSPTPKEIVAALERKGYDGLVYGNESPDETAGDSYIAFHSNQIKSAVGNNGEFDAQNASITKAGPIKNRPGLTQEERTDKDGTQVKRWVRTDKGEGGGDPKAAPAADEGKTGGKGGGSEGPKGPRGAHEAKPGEHITYRADDGKTAAGKVVGTGKEGLTVEGVGGVKAHVPWEDAKAGQVHEPERFGASKASDQDIAGFKKHAGETEEQQGKATSHKGAGDDEQAVYRQAVAAHREFTDVMNRSGGLADKLHAEVFDGDSDAAMEYLDAHPDQAVIMLAPIKGRQRASEKASTEGWANVRDIVRGSIVVPSLDQVGDAVKAVKAAGLSIVRMKNRFHSPVGGYRDILMNVRMPNGHVGELQIHAAPMLQAKQKFGGHDHYKAWRDVAESAERGKKLTDEEQGRMGHADKHMQDLYDTTWQGMRGSV